MFMELAFSARLGGANGRGKVGEKLADMPRRRYAIRLAYEGGPFRGFQRQAGLPTVQDALQRELSACGVEGSLAVAARTDAGVHALAQVVSVATSRDLDADALRPGLNR